MDCVDRVRSIPAKGTGSMIARARASPFRANARVGPGWNVPVTSPPCVPGKIVVYDLSKHGEVEF